MLHKQKGFTLLELLVVITLLAVLSVGALVAYEGIGENANNVAAANNIKTADSSIRAYRAIENVYPNQWDNLANIDGTVADGTVGFLSDATKSFFGQWQATSADAVAQKVAVAMDSVGINEFQSLNGGATFAETTAPNERLNESAPGLLTGDAADELTFVVNNGVFASVDYDGGPAATWNISVVPSGGNAQVCTAAGGAFNTAFDTTVIADNLRLNRINDALDDDACNLVIAVGFGKDVPGTTLGSRVAISTAPTYANGNTVNPSVHYARYIALFHVASDEDADGTIQEGEVLPKPRLIAVVDTEGRNIDQAIAGAYASN